jgi:menaquinone-dependent protoporphyrinogen oxidase
MARVLLAYASTHEQTAKIAERVAQTLRAEGLEVDMCDVAHTGGADPAGLDAVIVGASLHLGRHQREVVDWVKVNGATLADPPSAFLSVSLTAAEDTEEAHEATQRCIDDFLKETGWTPQSSVTIAGATDLDAVERFGREFAASIR